jgi:hypothetical protein
MTNHKAKRANSAEAAIRQGAEFVLKAVRGPFFLSVISLSLLLVIPAAQATLLKGYISTSDDTQGTAEAASAEAPRVPGLVEDAPDNQSASSVQTNNLAATDAVASPAEAAMRQRVAGLQGAITQSDSFPPSFAGAWKCVTVVVGSAVDTVSVGQRVESQVRFMAQPDGRVVAKWQQPGWTEAAERITRVNEREAALDRTNYFINHGEGGWAAHSTDHYTEIAPNRISAYSNVEQFASGQYMGRYQTRSMLYRVNEDVAFASK